MPWGYGVVGDSIADNARYDTRRVLDRRSRGRVFAEPGGSIRDQFDALRNFVANSDANAPAFINLGTNDVFHGNRGLRAIREALDILGDRPVYWASVRTHGVNPFYGRNWTDRATAFNRGLRQIAGNRSNVNVMDWGNYSRGHRNWFRPDGLHLNRVGSANYAAYLNRHYPTYDTPTEPPDEPTV